MPISSEYLKDLEARFKKPTTTDSEFQEAVRLLMDFMGEGRNVKLMYKVATANQRSGYISIKQKGTQAQKDWAEMVWQSRFKYWCGRTSVIRGNKARGIKDMMARCRDAENPQKSFNARLKVLRLECGKSKYPKSLSI